MTELPDDSPLEPDLLDAARQWREPPPPPRDEMWREIGRRRAARRSIRPAWRRYGFPLGIAALIALGIGLGRWSAPGPVVPRPVQTVATIAPATPDNRSITVVANEHLSRTEAFLTEFRAASRGTAVPDHFAATSRDLLLETRLLMDAPALQDARVRSLLQDLEVILVQIAQLHNDTRPDDVEIITNGLKQRDMLPRLRTAIPAGLDARHTRGES
ncbi:MAG: hypothetical protein ABI765_09700 [Gemmatimonadota bacterium]